MGRMGRPAQTPMSMAEPSVTLEMAERRITLAELRKEAERKSLCWRVAREYFAVRIGDRYIPHSLVRIAPSR